MGVFAERISALSAADDGSATRGNWAAARGRVSDRTAFRPGARPVAASALPYLDLSALPQYIAATCCRPALTDIRRGFEFPEQSSPLGAHPSREGWALEGCSDSFTLKYRLT